MSLRRSLVAAAVIATAASVWGVAAAQDAPDLGRPIVLVSGLDDHGLLATETVDVLDAPDGASVGSVADGTLVAVLGERSEWLQVQSIEGAPVAGWINDFHLRGTAHVVDPAAPACATPGYGEAGGAVTAALEPSLQVELLDVHGEAGSLWLGVRSVAEPDVVALVPRDSLQQLPGPPPVPGVACTQIRPDPEAVGHRH